MDPQFNIYQIRNYETYWDMHDAVVSGVSEEDACKVLEDYLGSGEESPKWKGKDIGFNLRGEIINTHIKADKRAVIYTRHKTKFP